MQIDQERDESSRTSVTPTQDEGASSIDFDATRRENDERMFNAFQSMKTSLGNEYEMEILKECFESLEKTLENTEKERDHFQVNFESIDSLRIFSILSLQQLYQKTLKDFQEMEEKYRKATELIQELQDR